jgi:MoaA/NifB/PqqE/SkfB family radical SAM enzyme
MKAGRGLAWRAVFFVNADSDWFGSSWPSMNVKELLRAGRIVLGGRSPMLSIEITRECPLRCPGCYAYGENHLGGGGTLRELSDLRGDALVDGVLELVRRHRPVHVSIVGGEPLMRHKELSRILPELGRMDIFTLLVTSAVIPIPPDWIKIPRLRIVVSVDGLPEHHDVRRKPATYERVLKNISGLSVNIHWTITGPMVRRSTYLEEYVSFWSARSEVNRIWVSLYTPQIGERSAEVLTPFQRDLAANELVALSRTHPKLLINRGMANALVEPPNGPEECLFSKMSINYSADLSTRVEPCVFGGKPDCRQCGCAISSGLHWIQGVKVAGPVTVNHLASTAVAIGSLRNRLRGVRQRPERWRREVQNPSEIIRISGFPQDPA